MIVIPVFALIGASFVFFLSTQDPDSRSEEPKSAAPAERVSPGKKLSIQEVSGDSDINQRVRGLQGMHELPPEKRQIAESLVRGGDELLAVFDSSPREAPEAVHSLLERYHLSIKPPNGLPTGTNEEIVEVLLGDNAWGIPFFSPNHSAIDSEGRLTDPWDTPFFFHVQSAEDISVRSAGPDRIMWNEDDLLYPPALDAPVEMGTE